MSIVFRFLAAAFAVLLAAYLVPGFHVENFYTALMVAVALGILNITVRPIILLLTLPLNLLTLGLFSFVINAGLIYFVSTFVKGFSVDGFIPALLGGAVIAIAGWILHKLT